MREDATRVRHVDIRSVTDMGKDKKEYTGETENVVLSLPKNTVKLKATATVWVDDKPKKMVMKLGCDGIAQAREDYLMLDPTDDAFATYVINPEFADFLEEWKDKGLSYEEISDIWSQSHNG